MRNILLIVVCGVLLSVSQVAMARDQFEGKWTITVTSDDGGKPHEDTLIFKNGKLISQSAKAHGFAEADYEADVRGGQSATFTATAKSTREGSMKWTGTMAATSLQGTFMWTKADGSSESFSYSGMRAEK
jgi:hypothetical protein